MAQGCGQRYPLPAPRVLTQGASAPTGDEPHGHLPAQHAIGRRQCLVEVTAFHGSHWIRGHRLHRAVLQRALEYGRAINPEEVKRRMVALGGDLAKRLAGGTGFDPVNRKASGLGEGGGVGRAVVLSRASERARRLRIGPSGVRSGIHCGGWLAAHAALGPGAVQIGGQIGQQVLAPLPSLSWPGPRTMRSTEASRVPAPSAICRAVPETARAPATGHPPGQPLLGGDRASPSPFRMPRPRRFPPGGDCSATEPFGRGGSRAIRSGRIRFIAGRNSRCVRHKRKGRNGREACERFDETSRRTAEALDPEADSASDR